MTRNADAVKGILTHLKEVAHEVGTNVFVQHGAMPPGATVESYTESMIDHHQLVLGVAGATPEDIKQIENATSAAFKEGFNDAAGAILLT